MSFWQQDKVVYHTTRWRDARTSVTFTNLGSGAARSPEASAVR